MSREYNEFKKVTSVTKNRKENHSNLPDCNRPRYGHTLLLMGNEIDVEKA